jgi:predicted branched-subunit amino acid permease
LKNLLSVFLLISFVALSSRARYLPVGFGITDETFAFFSLEKGERASVAYMLGLITVAYSSWVGGTALGALVSGLLPKVVASSLGIALYALFIALVTPDVKKSLRLFLVVLFTAIVNTVLGCFLPQSWSIIAATLIGASAGVFFVDDRALGIVPEEETGGAVA